jgi:hypothetical protein
MKKALFSDQSTQCAFRPGLFVNIQHMTPSNSHLTGVLNHWLFFGKAEGRLGRNP